MPTDAREAAMLMIESFAGQPKTINIPVDFIEYTGSLDCAIFLNQLLYWKSRTTHPKGWIFKTYAEWKEEIHLSEYEVRKAFKVLKAKGFLDKDIQKAYGNPTVHYILNVEKFSDSFLEFLQERKRRNSRNVPSLFTESLTEITTEITTETSSKGVSGKHKLSTEWQPLKGTVDEIREMGFTERQIELKRKSFVQYYTEVSKRRLTDSEWAGLFISWFNTEVERQERRKDEQATGNKPANMWERRDAAFEERAKTDLFADVTD